VSFRSIAKPILSAVLMVLTSAPAWAQSKEQKAGARAAAEAGGDAFDAGRYAEAADLYERAERILHAPPHLLYAARAHAKLGNLVEAREHYLTLTREPIAANAPRAFREAQQAGEKELAALEPRIPYVSVVVQGGGGSAVRVTRNAQPMPAELLGVPTPVNPGDYSYQAFADGMESSAARIRPGEGVRETVVLTLRALPGGTTAAGSSGKHSQGLSAGASSTASPTTDSGASSGASPLFVGGLVSLGVSAAAGGLGTYFLLQGLGTRSDSNAIFDSCNPSRSCTPEQQEDILALDREARTPIALAVTGYVVAGVGLATGITLLVLDSDRSAAASASVVPLIGPGFVGATGRF
jgi:hypothetical protein